MKLFEKGVAHYQASSDGFDIDINSEVRQYLIAVYGPSDKKALEMVTLFHGLNLVL